MRWQVIDSCRRSALSWRRARKVLAALIQHSSGLGLSQGPATQQTVSQAPGPGLEPPVDDGRKRGQCDDHWNHRVATASLSSVVDSRRPGDAWLRDGRPGNPGSRSSRARAWRGSGTGRVALFRSRWTPRAPPDSPSWHPLDANSTRGAKPPSDTACPRSASRATTSRQRCVGSKRLPPVTQTLDPCAVVRDAAAPSSPGSAST
jgi:hypothetical protein